jgi:hypothetical protein
MTTKSGEGSRGSLKGRREGWWRQSGEERGRISDGERGWATARSMPTQATVPTASHTHVPHLDLVGADATVSSGGIREGRREVVAEQGREGLGEDKSGRKDRVG